MSSRMGRPTVNPRTISITLRLSERESKTLQECADKLNITRTNVIAKGIELVKATIENEE